MSKSNMPIGEVKNLFTQAADAGVISPESLATLTARDLGAKIRDALGVSADQIESSEVFLLALLIDDSSSIRFAAKAQAVRDGHNEVLAALKRSKSSGDILVHATALNSGIIYPFTPLDSAPELTASNYDPNGCTPLYDQSIAVLGTVLAKEREFASQGVPVRTATLIVTDGEDVGSRQPVLKVASVVRDMRQRETHIVAAMGIDNGHTDFKTVFSEMGIESKWILLPGDDPKSIRRCFEVFSKSTAQASQGAGAFSKALGGGFATP